MEIETKVIKKVLARLKPSCNSRLTLPILANVAIQTEPGKIVFQTTNLEFTTRVAIPCDHDEKWETTVNLKDLSGAVESAKTTSFTLDEQYLSVNGFRLPTIDIKEFPIFNQGVITNEYSYIATELLDGMSSVIGSCSTDDARPVLESINITTLEKDFECVASNGFTLTVWNKQPDRHQDNEILVPLKTAKAIIGALKMAIGIVRITKLADGNAEVRLTPDYGTVTINFLPVSGNFPDIRVIIPKARTFEFSIARENLLDIAKKAAKVNFSIAMFATCREKMIFFASEDNNEFKDTIPVHGNAEVAFAICPSFVVKALEAINDETITLSGTKHNYPLVITSLGRVCLIMPMSADKESFYKYVDAKLVDKFRK